MNKPKIAFVFPGQGAQYVGMGMDFIDKYPELEKPLLDFDNNNDTDLRSILKNGPADLLTQTKWTQPAILFHSITAMMYMMSKTDKINPSYVAGHSLGEFTALVANGVLDLADALYLVHKRGEFMIEANAGSSFAMSAIIGLEAGRLKSICEYVSAKHLVVVANYNTPEQTVISGTDEGVKLAGNKAKEAGAKIVIPLPVGGAFHSPLISKAGQWLSEEMKGIDFDSTDIPVISNVDAHPYTEPEQIKANLARQVASPVLWFDSVYMLKELGVSLFIEFGPKKVVAGMIKKIDRNLQVISVDKETDVDIAIEKIDSFIS